MRLQQGKEENENSIILFMKLQVSLGKGDKFHFLSCFEISEHMNPSADSIQFSSCTGAPCQPLSLIHI